MKQLHCTSRLGFNFSYSVPLNRSNVSLSSFWQHAMFALSSRASFSPFFHSETIKRVGFVTLS